MLKKLEKKARKRLSYVQGRWAWLSSPSRWGATLSFKIRFVFWMFALWQSWGMNLGRKTWETLVQGQRTKRAREHQSCRRYFWQVSYTLRRSVKGKLINRYTCLFMGCCHYSPAPPPHSLSLLLAYTHTQMQWYLSSLKIFLFSIKFFNLIPV